MEGMRQIANAYYQKSDMIEKMEVGEYFSKLDTDGDGKVSLADFKEALHNRVECKDEVFRQLDVNQKGYLNFTDSIVVYYMNKISMCRCDGCSACLYGMYFSCKQCLGNGDATFDLCCDCYSKGVDHRHSTANMLDYHSLVRLLRKRATAEKNLRQMKSTPSSSQAIIVAPPQQPYSTSTPSSSQAIIVAPAQQPNSKMDGMREIANAYYQRSDEVEKKKVQEFFNKLDTDSDGKVSLAEFKKVGLEDFQKFDINQDGYLSFSEAIVVYFLLKISWYTCSGCSGILYGMHFSCEQCLGKGKNTFDLCCDCYIKGVDHHHSTTDLLDSHSLFRLLVRRTTAEENGLLVRCTTAEENGQSQRKREMEQLQEIAMAYFNAGSKDVKALARQFYKSMDIDGNGSVGVRRFVAFMKEEGYSKMSTRKIFHDISHGGDSLSFENGMTLYYIIKSGRPICNGCDKLIPGIYFSCIKCVAFPNRAFNLCKACYKERKRPHSHEGQDAPPLIDNYTLLQFMMNTSPSSVSDTAVTGKSYESTPSSSQAIIVAPAQQPNSKMKWNVGVDATLSVAAAIQAVAAIVVGCTIM